MNIFPHFVFHQEEANRNQRLEAEGTNPNKQQETEEIEGMLGRLEFKLCGDGGGSMGAIGSYTFCENVYLSTYRNLRS